MSGRNHSREFKLRVVRELAKGEKRPIEACREYALADSVLFRWRKEYEERGEEAFTPKEPNEVEALEKRVGELERYAGQLALENDILKKALKRTTPRLVIDTT